MNWKRIEISKIKLNKDNPRVIKDDKFKKLVESVKNFPQMLEIRPVVVNRDFVVIGGNQRFKACQEAGFKEIPIVFADDLTPEQEKEFMIKDNVQSGEWDFDLLKGFELEDLTDWGLEMNVKTEDEIYSRKVVSPVYEVKGEKPDLKELFDDSKARLLIEEIEKSSIPAKIKKFLKLASYRHVVFNFEKIAEFYAGESKEVQAAGGMTDAYLDGGTYVKSFYSLMLCPSFVRIKMMGEKHKRLHHSVKWKNAVPVIIDEKHKKYV